MTRTSGDLVLTSRVKGNSFGSVFIGIGNLNSQHDNFFFVFTASLLHFHNTELRFG